MAHDENNNHGSARTATINLEELLLMAMWQHNFTTLTEIAVRLERQRPAVSRSFSQLAKRGFVTKNGRLPALTAEGRAEAERIKSDLPKRQEALDKSITSLRGKRKSLDRVTRSFID